MARYLIEEIIDGTAFHSIAMTEKDKNEIVKVILNHSPDQLKVYILNENSLLEEHNL